VGRIVPDDPPAQGNVPGPVDDTEQRRARSFGEVADAYARARPSYPPAAVEWLLEGAPGDEIVDLAAGTGKLTRVVAASGRRVTAVEPLPGMRTQLAAAVPQARALDGSAEAIPLPDASCDGVVVGQAFHWFDAPRALDEIARVLRPGGVLGLVWNLRDDRVPWVAALTEAMDSPADVISSSRRVETEPADAHPAFGATERREFPNPEPFTRERLRDWARSTSGLAVMDGGRREQVLTALDALVDTDPALRGRAEFSMPFIAVCVRAQRL
jgi:ubiquinone/menaquinone biosynthesis C-methylase UbiE